MALASVSSQLVFRAFKTKVRRKNILKKNNVFMSVGGPDSSGGDVCVSHVFITLWEPNGLTRKKDHLDCLLVFGSVRTFG